MSGVDFLLGNDLAGGKVWMQSPSACAEPDVETAETADSVCYVTRSKSKAKRAIQRWVPTGSVTHAVNCNKAG